MARSYDGNCYKVLRHVNVKGQLFAPGDTISCAGRDRAIRIYGQRAQQWFEDNKPAPEPPAAKKKTSKKKSRAGDDTA